MKSPWKQRSDSPLVLTCSRNLSQSLYYGQYPDASGLLDRLLVP
jgi:hypothetical protein